MGVVIVIEELGDSIVVTTSKHARRGLLLGNCSRTIESVDNLNKLEIIDNSQSLM